MKFLIFNLAVAVSLVYLLTTDRADFQRVAGSVHDAAGEIKTMTERAVGNGRKLLDRTVSAPTIPGPTIPGPKTAETRPQPPAMEPPPPLPPAIPAPKSTTSPQGRTAVADLAVTDPAVAKRRGEILAGIAPNPPEAKLPPESKRPALKEGEPMMTPAQRRKELYSLAEEMELLYARTVSR